WGDARDAAEETRRRVARPIEKDLERVLVDMAEDFPLIAALVERRDGGQRKLPIGRPADADAHSLIAASIALAAEAGEAGPSASESTGRASESATAVAEPPAAEAAPAPVHDGSTIPAPATGPKRPARYGLSVQFESREGDSELARLVEITVWVNDAHPAYHRAAA